MQTATTTTTAPRKPALEALGGDLLRVGRWERAWSLALPFVFMAGCFYAGARGWWAVVVLCAMGQTFFTYGSISHDLVHRTLRLPAWLNDALLCAIELASFRSGHAYRLSHLHHHARFPAEDDLEGLAARLSWWRALLDGVVTQPRLWWWACRHAQGGVRRWVVAEGLAVLALLAACAAAWPWTPVPAVYAGLMLAGSWTFPFITSYLPHDPHGRGALQQTRLFRGRVLGWLAFEHLYHLEHHLYPQVPHHRWRELARRLDPYFAEQGIQPIVLWR
jgi:beta-carotene hydroxylase